MDIRVKVFFSFKISFLQSCFNVCIFKKYSNYCEWKVVYSVSRVCYLQSTMLGTGGHNDVLTTRLA